MSDLEKMETLMNQSIAAAQEEAKAKLIAAQAAEKAASEAKRAADTNARLIAGVQDLLKRNPNAREIVDMLEQVVLYTQHLIQVTQMIVTIIASEKSSAEARELQKRMHELAMMAASRGIRISAEGGSSTSVGDVSQFGDESTVVDARKDT